jgi:hypothetical protein
MDAPTIPVVAQVGDTVQVTREDETPGDGENALTVGTFDITEMTDTHVSGSPTLGTLLLEDWRVELIKKTHANLALPTTLSEVAVWLRTAEAAHLVGKGDQWRVVETGQVVDLDMVLGWRDWDDWEAAWNAHKASAAIESDAEPAEDQ